MKTLPLTYTANGYLHKQIKREEDIAIYVTIEPLSNRIIGYEVFRIVKQIAKTVFRQLLEDKEMTPGNSLWGFNAFSPSTLKQAIVRFEQLKSATIK